MRLHQLNVGHEKNVRLWRNNVGVFFTKDDRPVRTGLCNGSADLIGFESITVTPAMIGKKIAVFRADEVKVKNRPLSPDQKLWLKMCADNGAIVNVIREEDV